jgi:hypothetical protein
MAHIYYIQLNIGCINVFITNDILDVINNGSIDSITNVFSTNNNSYMTDIIVKLKYQFSLYYCKYNAHNIQNNIFYMNNSYFIILYNCIIPLLLDSFENKNNERIEIINNILDIYLKIYNNISCSENYKELNRQYLIQFHKYTNNWFLLENHYKILVKFLLNYDNIYNIKHNRQYICIKDKCNNYKCNIL